MSRTGCKRESRYKVFEVVSATVAGAERRAHMINVSLSGALLHMDQSARLGEPVALHWEGRAIAGQIVWASPPRFGLRFQNPLPLATLAAFLWHSQVSEKVALEQRLAARTGRSG